MNKMMIAAFLTRALAASGSLFLSFVLARLIGSDGVGFVMLFVTMIGFLSLLARFGADSLMLRHASIHFFNVDIAGYFSARNTAILYVLAASSAISLIVLFSRGGVVEIYSSFDRNEMQVSLIVLSFIVAPYSILYMCSALMKAIGKSWASPLFETGGVHFVVAVLICGAYIFNDSFSVSDVILMLLFACIIMISIAYIWIARIENSALSATGGRSSVRFEMLKQLPDYGVISLSGFFFQGGVTLMLGYYLSPAEVGLFSVSFRLALLVNFILVVVNSVVAPKFAVLHNRGESRELENIVYKAARGMIFLSVPICIAMAFFASEILSVFGEEFKEAKVVLWILLAMQMFNVATGTTSSLLNMTGGQKINKKINVACVIMNISLCLFLIPLHGVIGGAIALLAAMVVKNAASVYFIKKSLGINVLALRRSEG